MTSKYQSKDRSSSFIRLIEEEKEPEKEKEKERGGKGERREEKRPNH